MSERSSRCRSTAEGSVRPTASRSDPTSRSYPGAAPADDYKLRIYPDFGNVPDEGDYLAIMGPSGCGKTTLIRCINRMHELVPGARVEGRILLCGENVYKTNPILSRRKIGMVFQRPNPFPTMSIYDNVIAGYKLNGIRVARGALDRILEESLKRAALWDEVSDKLHTSALQLSGGQQQRVCIARALAIQAALPALKKSEPPNSLTRMSS